MRLTLTRPTDTTYKHPSFLISWALVCIFAYLFHLSYLLSGPRFDYAYNMAANLTVGMIHNALWVAYSLAPFIRLRLFPAKPSSYRPRFIMTPAIIVLFTMFAIGLEVFDFPPWGRVIDAHSLWHGCTIPLVYFWYKFLVEDSNDEGWKGERI
jgi:post-GPI attachment to proteins factor 3